MGDSSLRISKALYIWGQFEDSSLKELTALKDNINQKLNGPNFEPHLTLSGPILDSVIDIDSCLSKHLKSYSRIVLNIDGFEIKNEFFQALFLKVTKNNSLLKLKNTLDKLLELESFLLSNCGSISALKISPYHLTLTLLLNIIPSIAS